MYSNYRDGAITEGGYPPTGVKSPILNTGGQYKTQPGIEFLYKVSEKIFEFFDQKV